MRLAVYRPRVSLAVRCLRDPERPAFQPSDQLLPAGLRILHQPFVEVVGEGDDLVRAAERLGVEAICRFRWSSITVRDRATALSVRTSIDRARHADAAGAP